MFRCTADAQRAHRPRPRAVARCLSLRRVTAHVCSPSSRRIVMPFSSPGAGVAVRELAVDRCGPARTIAGLTGTVYAKGLKHVAALVTDDEGRLWVATAAAEDDKGNDGISS